MMPHAFVCGLVGSEGAHYLLMADSLIDLSIHLGVGKATAKVPHQRWHNLLSPIAHESDMELSS